MTTTDPLEAYVIAGCHCDRETAKFLLQTSNNDRFEAVAKYKAMDRSRGLPKPSTGPAPPTTGGRKDPDHESGKRVARRSTGCQVDDTPADPGGSPLETLSPCSSVSGDDGNSGLDTSEADLPSTGKYVPPHKKQQRWDFKLAQLPYADAEDILMTAGNSHDISPLTGQPGYDMDPSFSISKLCAALQHGASLSTVRTYLQNFPQTTVKSRINDAVKGAPSIFYAIETNNEALLRLWASFSADMSATHPANGMPLLAYAIILGEVFEGRNTSPLVATLLSLGASPKTIPDSFYVDYCRDLDEAELVRHIDGIDKTDSGRGIGGTTPRKEWQWCAEPRVRRILARATHLTQRYHLERATMIKQPGPRTRQVAQLQRAEALLGLPYYLVGQDVAAGSLMRKLVANITLRSQRPLVLVFAGPSGHGKTELARKLGDLRSLDLEAIDCTVFNEERELFGPRSPYYGSDKGSPLNNFLTAHNGKPSIVFLDEFEKTTAEIHKSLLVPFANGEYEDRRTRTKVDCSQTIWILATNALDGTIMRFCSDNPSILQDWTRTKTGVDNQPNTVELSNKLARQLGKVFKQHFGAPIRGRVSDFIPFLPFSVGEQAVVAHKFLLEFAARLAAPVQLQESAKHEYIGDIRLHFRHDASLCRNLAQADYQEELGARSLCEAVEKVEQNLVDSYLEEDGEIKERLNGVKLTDYVVDCRADEVVVRRGTSRGA